VWVLIGDAELDEGSNHEAIAYAGPAGLEQLHTLVIALDPSGLRERITGFLSAGGRQPGARRR
jgi:transketolase N-terminal domain/subunit